MTAPRKLPGSLAANPLLERWLRISREGTVTVYPGKVEIGQGILTAIAQVAILQSAGNQRLSATQPANLFLEPELSHMYHNK